MWRQSLYKSITKNMAAHQIWCHFHSFELILTVNIPSLFCQNYLYSCLHTSHKVHRGDTQLMMSSYFSLVLLLMSIAGDWVYSTTQLWGPTPRPLLAKSASYRPPTRWWDRFVSSVRWDIALLATTSHSNNYSREVEHHAGALSPGSLQLQQLTREKEQALDATPMYRLCRQEYRQWRNVTVNINSKLWKWHQIWAPPCFWWDRFVLGWVTYFS